jgi:8-oxo-dGTP diphosphatase
VFGALKDVEKSIQKIWDVVISSKRKATFKSPWKEKSIGMNPQEHDKDKTHQALRPTHVVTCFLMRLDTNTPHILIVQRSTRVGSYQSQWAGVSGFVEANVTPDEQAYTEIREETGLQGGQMRMLRRGTVVEHLDPAIERHWYIHPFLFEVLAPDAIHTDWEAVEMRWILPSELSNYETVPKLLEVYNSAINGEEVT